MKALSLWQPWATAIALGIKPYETRNWATAYRGPLVVCSAQRRFRHEDYAPEYYRDVCARLKRAGCPQYALRYGEALCVVDLVDCVRTSQLRGVIARDAEFWGDFTDGHDGEGRYAFKLQNVRPIWPPHKVVGRQGFFDISDLPAAVTGIRAEGNLELFASYQSVRRTRGVDCTSVPTPQRRDHFPGHSDEFIATKKAAGHGMANLNDSVMLASVPTPMAGSLGTETYNAAGNMDYSRRIVELAPITTPSASDGKRGGIMTAQMSRSSLVQMAALAKVATPRSEDSQCAGAHRGKADTLHSQTQLATGCTPSARDYKDTPGMSESGVDPDGSRRTWLDQLPRQAQLANSGQTATGGTDATASTGQLNPRYSAWLMGLPAIFDIAAMRAHRSLKKRKREC